MRDNSGKALPVVLVVFALLIIAGTVGAIFYLDYMQGKDLNKSDGKIPFGVFTGVKPTDGDAYTRLFNYKLVVIDPENYDREDIGELKIHDVLVYGYINLGSADKTAENYQQFEDIAIGPYEGWPDEVWVDASARKWQEYINAKIGEYTAKGIDGFFVDNCDIYYYVTNGAGVNKADSGAVRQSLLDMIAQMKKRYKEVIINGADTFVSYCIRNNDDVTALFDFVAQESVFTAVNTETGEFGEGLAGAYYETYLKKCKGAGLGVYLIEYSKNEAMKAKIKKFCDENGYDYYVSETVNFK